MVQDGQTALHVSSRLGDYNTVQLLLQHSADVDALMRDHYTPLHIAVKHQHSDIISILLSHSAKLDVKSKVSRSMYSYISETIENWRIVTILD